MTKTKKLIPTLLAAGLLASVTPVFASAQSVSSPSIKGAEMQVQSNVQWKYVTTQKITQNLERGSVTIAASALLSLVPGLGNFTNAVSVIENYRQLGQDTVYLKIMQYVSPDNRTFRDVIISFSDPGYTKVINQTEHIHRPFG